MIILSNMSVENYHYFQIQFYYYFLDILCSHFEFRRHLLLAALAIQFSSHYFLCHFLLRTSFHLIWLVISRQSEDCARQLPLSFRQVYSLYLLICFSIFPIFFFIVVFESLLNLCCYHIFSSVVRLLLKSCHL